MISKSRFVQSFPNTLVPETIYLLNSHFERLESQSVDINFVPDWVGQIIRGSVRLLLHDSIETAHIFLREISNTLKHPDLFFNLACLDLYRGDVNAACLNFKNAVYNSDFDKTTINLKLEEISTRVDSGDRFGAFIAIYDKFRDFLTPLLLLLQPRKNECQSYNFVFARSIESIGIHNLNYKILDELDISDYSNWVWIYRGHLAWLKNDIKITDYNYSLAMKHCSENNIIPFHYDCGIVSWLNFSEVQSIAFNSNNQDLNKKLNARHVHPISSNFNFVISIGADKNYLKYLEVILKTIRKSIPKDVSILIHLTTINLEIDIRENLIDIVKFLDGNQISFGFTEISYETRDVAFYTCLRFFFSKYLLDIFRKNIYIMDIDTIIDSNFFTENEYIKKFRIGLTMHGFIEGEINQSYGRPWTVAAGLSLFRPDPISYLMLDYVTNYIQNSYNSNKITNWTIDQCALSTAFFHFKNFFEKEDVINFAYKPDMVKYLTNETRKDFNLESFPRTKESIKEFCDFLKNN